MQKRYLYLLFSLFLFILLSLSGCWDYTDLTERGIIYAIALDKETVKKEHHEKEGYAIEEEDEGTDSGGENQDGKKQYVVTLQLIEPTAIAGAEKAGMAKGPTWNIASTKADSVSGAIHEIDSRLYREPFLSHVRVILIGEELARDGITKSLDFLIREPYIRKGTPVMVTKGPAQEVLNLESPLVNYSGIYLSLIPKTTDRLKQTPKLDLGLLTKHIHEGSNFIAPRATLSSAKNEIKYGGAAVFKKDKMIGWLGEGEVLDLSLCCEECKETPLDAECPRKEDKGTFQVEIKNKKNYYDFQYKDGKVQVKTKIYVIADLKELQCRKCKMLDVKETALMEEALSKNIEDRVKYTCNQIQEKFGVDIYGIGDQIKKYDQDIWKKVEKDWDQHFKNLTYDVEVVSSLRTAGVECRPDLTEKKK